MSLKIIVVKYTMILISFLCMMPLFLSSIADETGLSFEDVTFADLKNASYILKKISYEDIQKHYNILFVRTNEERYAKLLLEGLSRAGIAWRRVVIYNPNGALQGDIEHLKLKIGESYDLDDLKTTDSDADIVFKSELDEVMQVVYYVYGINGASLALPSVEGSSQSSNFGKLLIKSIPSQADIYVDGEYKGVTPKEIQLTAGAHEIKVVKPGYKVWAKMVVIKAGEEREIIAHLVRPPQPTLKWMYETEGAISSSVLGDINGDGKLEVIFGSYDGAVYALDSRGQLLWYFNARYSVGPPALGDINNDGKPEVVVGAGLNTDPKGYIYVLNSEGRMLWLYETESGAAYSAPTLGDLNGDGNLEIILGVEAGTLYVLDSKGQLLWKFKVNGKITTSPALGDLNGDGLLDIVFGATDDYLYALNPDGKLLWKYNIGSDVRSSAVLGDLNGDGELEVVVGSYQGDIYLLSSKGDLEWIYNTGEAAICASPAVGDISGDGELEIVIGPCYGTYPDLRALSSKGYQLWSYNTPGSIFTSPVIADVDGDGEMEVMVGSYHNSVLILNSNGELQSLYETEGKIYSSLTIGDLENDGKLEIIASDSSEGLPKGVIYILHSTGSGEIQWACLGGNPWHTGNVEDAQSYGQALGEGPRAATQWALKGKVEEENLPPIAIFTFSPSSPIIGQVVTFDASSSSDPDGSIVKYEWDFGDGSIGEGQVVHHTFTKAGTYTVKLTVTDDDGATASAEQKVKVLESGGGGGPA